jgi:hypothetical protein
MVTRLAWGAPRGLLLWLLIALIFWAAAALLPGIDVPSFGAVLLTTALIVGVRAMHDTIRGVADRDRSRAQTAFRS